MPNRIIKESIRTSYEVDELSPNAEVTFYRLLTLADDYGRFPSDQRILQSQLFPLKTSVRAKDFNTWISELVKAGLIQLYIGDDDKPYGYFPTWEDHQNVRSKRSKYPEPIGDRYNDLDSQLEAVEYIRNHMKSDDIICPRESNPIQSESESESNSAGAGEPVPPDEELEPYPIQSAKKWQEGQPIDYESFVDYWNDQHNSQLRITDNKRSDIKKQLKHFTGFQIQKAIYNRRIALKDSEYLNSWESLFTRKIERMEKYLNMDPKNGKRNSTIRTAGDRQAEQLRDTPFETLS